MIIPVTAAIIVDSENKILIARRKPGLSNGALWEFPGGKLEENETPEDCLRREILEELHICIEVDKIFKVTTHRYPDFTILLLAYFCKFIEIKPGTPTDHDAFHWVAINKLNNYQFSPADIPIVENLRATFNEWTHAIN